MEFCFRAPRDEECALAAKLERVCLDTCWSEQSIRNLGENALYICCFSDNALCGIGSVYFVLDEAQIMNVAVLPEYRGKGVGFGIMSEIIKNATQRGCKTITLEVAENNTKALKLYEKCGMDRVGIRKGFYGDFAAIIMEKKI